MPVRVLFLSGTHLGLDLARSGFPFAPDVRTSFPALLAATGHADAAAEVRLLCLHPAVEGAKVGPVPRRRTLGAIAGSAR